MDKNTFQQVVDFLLERYISFQDALFLTEVSENKIQFLSNKYSVDVEKVKELTQIDSTGVYLEWLVKQVKNDRIRLPEDIDKITGYLKRYSRLKNSPRVPVEMRDINRFNSPGDLAQWLDSSEGVKSKGQVTRELSLEGQEVIYSRGRYKVVKVTTPEAAAQLFKHTEWCVKDPRWFVDYDPKVFYMVMKDNKPYVLIHAETGQVKDVYDNSIGARIGSEIQFVRSVISNIKLSDESFPLFSKEEILNIRSPRWAYLYACDVIRGRWPEAEEFIKKDPEWAHYYARDVIGNY